MVYKFFIILMLIGSYCNTQKSISNQEYTLIITPGEWEELAHTPIGFFAYFKSIIFCLNFYEKMKEKNDYAGAKILLSKGPYLDEEKGPNWWEYYFEPLKNSLPYASHIEIPFQTMIAFTAHQHFSRIKAHAIIKKHISIKQHILDKVETYYKNNFNDYIVIGVHYRGTDKIIENPRISYEKMLSEINMVLAKISSEKYKIFVATDEQIFVNYLKKHYKNVIHTDALRSDNNLPIHYGIVTEQAKINPYTLGEQALIDCLLLSKCNILIRTAGSHFSSTAAVFNPFISVISINSTSTDLLDRNYDYYLM